MATVKLFLDNARPLKDGCPIRLRFSANTQRADITLDVFVQPENWDKQTQMILSTEPKFKIKNKIIRERIEAAEDFLKEQEFKGRSMNDATKLRDMFLLGKKSIMFFDRMQEFIDNKEGKTKEVYTSTFTRLKLYTGGVDLYFDEMTPSWLTSFEKWCKDNGNKINTRGVHMRNIRAIFNAAIADRVISADLYPFKAFKIEKEPTTKRALSIEEFRSLLSFSGTPQENWARDVFLLSFFLIGINMKDLFYLEDFEDKTINYKRFKTGKIFDVKLAPEAMEIINRYRGETRLLNFHETIMQHENFTKKVNEYLAKAVTRINKREEEKGSNFRVKDFTTYAARHSWVTFAAELEIHGKTISRAMGHVGGDGGSLTTEIYTRHNDIKVKNANRKVIDYVYGRIEAPESSIDIDD